MAKKPWSFDAAAAAALISVGSATMLWMLWVRGWDEKGWMSWDVYGYTVPNWIYAADSFRRGYGLLWNSFQNCGQPFMALVQTAIFYPPHAVFLFLDPSRAILTIAAFHLSVGGVGAYALGRQLGLTRPSCFCGAIFFELTSVTIGLASWMPTTTLGPYVWIPAVMACCEKALASRRTRDGAILGGVLGIQFLNSCPQVSLYTYELIGLRILWELFTSSRPGRLRLVVVVVLGLVLGPLLGAVQLLPSVELALQSVRSGHLSEHDVFLTRFTWQTLLHTGPQQGTANPFEIVPCLLLAAALASASRRRIPAFYLLASGLSAALSVEGPLLDLYLRLPFGSMFRDPRRFLWVTSATLIVPIAAGVHALTAQSQTGSRKRRLAAGAVIIVGVAWAATSRRLTPQEWVILVGVVTLCVSTLLARQSLRGVSILLVLLLMWNLLHVGMIPELSSLRDISRYYTHKDTYELLRKHVEGKYRFRSIGGLDSSLMPKGASLFRLWSIEDYEPQTLLRYAQLVVRMVRPRKFGPVSNKGFIYFSGKPPMNMPLANLVGLRFVLSKTSDRAHSVLLQSNFQLREETEGLSIWENPNALPRAFFVPRIEVVEDADTLLERLASASNDPREIALVEEPPPGGNLGTPQATGQVTIGEDHSETFTLSVRATAPGFVFVSDQFYPGWSAIVNGTDAPVIRGNYAFRIVPVPAGTSEVVLRYEPLSVRLGVWISMVASVLVALFCAAHLVPSRLAPSFARRMTSTA